MDNYLYDLYTGKAELHSVETKGLREIKRETRWFEYDFFYPISITKDGNYYEATMFRKEYSIGITMFGTECNSWEEMLEMVENTAEEYINNIDWTIQIIENER